MAVENIILSREGFSEINKLCNYISTLIIKNESEAAEYETEYAFNQYLKYESSYMGSKSIYIHEYTIDDLMKFYPSDYIYNKNLMDPDVINDLVNKKDRITLSFLSYLENKFVENYTEHNQYYKQFMGKPPNASDKIAVQNLDSDNEDDLVDITQIDIDKYPNTYDYWFVKRNIDFLIRDNPDLVYLKFIEAPLSPYRVRKSPDFTILYSNNGLLSEDELMRFEKAYNKARVYVSEQLYVTGQVKRYPLYGKLVLLMILYYTVTNYFNGKLEDYSLRKYTRYDIYDILESNGLKNLTKISDFNILKKIVLNMDELNQYKGTEYALEMIFNLLNDSSISVKRFNLLKEFRIDNTGVLDIDTKKMYIDSVGLKFKEIPIAMDKNNKIESKSIKYVKYETMTENDDLWGGIDKNTSSDQKMKIKEDLKREIIQSDFDEVRTKYLSISKSMNIYEKAADTINILYLSIKYHYDYANVLGYNPFVDYNLNFQGIETIPIALFGGICYLTNIINEKNEPWVISPDRSFLYSVYSLRTGSGLNSQIKDITSTEINIGDPLLKTTIGEIFYNKEEVKKYLTAYNLTQFSTLKDVFKEYDKNKEVIQLLKDEIAKEKDAVRLSALKKLFDYNTSVFDFSYVFENHTDIREYLKIKSPALLGFIENLNTSITDESNRIEVLGTALQSMMNKFEEFMNVILDDIINFSFDSSKEDASYLEDLKILMNEYLSVFSELFRIEQTFTIEDYPKNRLKISYAQISTTLKSSDQMRFNTKIANKKSKLKRSDVENFIIKQNNTKILYKDKIRDDFNISYNLTKTKAYTTYSDRLSFNIVNSKQVIKDKNSFTHGIKYKLTKCVIKEE